MTQTNASDLAAMTRRVQVLEGEMRVMEEEMAALLAGESLDARMQRQAIDDRTKLRKKACCYVNRLHMHDG